jgi:hypothetical protein
MNQLVKRADSGNFRCEAPVDSTQVHCSENPIYVFPEKELRGLSPILFFIFMCLWAIYIFPGSVHIFCWACIFKRLWSPGIYSKEWIPAAYVAWRAGTITLFLLGS